MKIVQAVSASVTLCLVLLTGWSVQAYAAAREGHMHAYWAGGGCLTQAYCNGDQPDCHCVSEICQSH